VSSLRSWVCLGNIFNGDQRVVESLGWATLHRQPLKCRPPTTKLCRSSMLQSAKITTRRAPSFGDPNYGVLAADRRRSTARFDVRYPSSNSVSHTSGAVLRSCFSEDIPLCSGRFSEAQSPGDRNSYPSAQKLLLNQCDQIGIVD
jgi:hypothetical protein